MSGAGGVLRCIRGSERAENKGMSDSDQFGWAFRIFIDGGCPLCAREASFMERLDKGRGRLDVVDIAAAGFEPGVFEKDGVALTYDAMMASIHGQEPDGRIVTGVEVFRRSYEVVGWGWLLGWTRLPVLRWFADLGYAFFAKHRLRFTGQSKACEVPAGAERRAAG